MFTSPALAQQDKLGMFSLMLLEYVTWGLLVLFAFSSLFALCYYVNGVLPACAVAWICPMILLVMSQAGL